MSEMRATYKVTPTCITVSVIPETDWETRLCNLVRELRDSCKDSIIVYDYRTNTLRIFDGRALASIKVT